MSLLRTVSLVGLALLLLGGGVAVGSVVSGADDCTSGYGISIHGLDANGSVGSGAEVVAFGDLSPVEQRVFLEAYTDRESGNDYGSSPVYEDGVPWGDARAVEYRGERYEVGEWVSDCETGFGPTLLFGSVAVVVLGVLLLGSARAARTSRESDG